MYERFTDRSRKVMQLANQEAQRFNHEYIGTEHILLALIKEGSGVAANVLKNLDIDLRKIRLEVEKIVQSGPDMVSMGKLPQTPRAKKVLEYAIEEARNLNHNYIGTEHLLLGLVREEEGVASQVLMNLGVKLTDVREEVLNLMRDSRERTDAPPKVSQARPAPEGFGHDLSAAAQANQLDPVAGRQEEIERVGRVLLCRSANNPILVGEVGVGKSAVVRGVAIRTGNPDAPMGLRGRRLVRLELPRVTLPQPKDVLAATANILDTLDKNVLAYLDDLSLLQGRPGTPGGLLRAAVLRGDLQCLSVATPEQYRTAVESDAALGRVFRPVWVAPTSREETTAVLRCLRAALESRHQVRIEDAALTAAVELSCKLLPGQCLPGAAVRVLDEACAAARTTDQPAPPDVAALEAEVARLLQEKEAAVARQQFEAAAHLRDQADRLQHKIQQQRRAWADEAAKHVGLVTEALVTRVVGEMRPPGVGQSSSGDANSGGLTEV
jgi:ATP-dependent Clp protease ATP-binding subunit ClpC